MAIDVSKQVAKAEKAFSQRKYDMAIEIYLQAMHIDPNNRAARRGVRLAALKKHEHSYPSRMSIKIGTAGAKMGMMSPNPDRKMAAYESCLKVDPKSIKLNLNLAEIAEKAGYNMSAIGTLEGAIVANPKEIEAYVNLGRLLGPVDPEEAIGHLERALALNAKHPAALKLRKDIAAELSIKRTGFETAKNTHDLLRDSAKTMAQLDDQRIQQTSAQATTAVDRLEQEYRDNPGDRHLCGRLAKAYASANRHADAEKVYADVIASDPGDFDAIVQLGDLRLTQLDRQIARANGPEKEKLELKRLDVQVTEFARRVAEHPTDLGLRFVLGEAFLKLNRIDEAIAEFQRAVKDPRKRFESLSLLGECFLAKDLFDLAARQLERALEESPGLSSEKGKAVVYNLGLLREKQGDVPAAREHYLQVYEVDVAFRDVAGKVMGLSG